MMSRDKNNSRREWTQKGKRNAIDTAFDDIDNDRHDREIRIAEKAIAEWCVMYPGESPYKTFAEWDEWKLNH